MVGSRKNAQLIRPVTIRQSLFRSLLFLVVFQAGMILVTTFFLESRAVGSLSKSVIKQTNDRTEREVGCFFGSVQGTVLTARDWGRVALVEPEPALGLSNMVVHVMNHNPEIAAVHIGDMEGYRCSLWRGEEAHTWLGCEVRPGQAQEEITRLQWTIEETDNGGMSSVLVEEATTGGSRDGPMFDPWREKWFRIAADTVFGNAEGSAGATSATSSPASRADTAVVWTEPTKEGSMQPCLMTAWVGVQGKEGEPHLIGFDVRLDDISAFTTGLRPSTGSLAFVMTGWGPFEAVEEKEGETGEGRIIGLSRDAPSEDATGGRDDVLAAVDGPAIKALEVAYHHLKAVESEEAEQLTFDCDGEVWWGGFRRCEVGTGRWLWLGVVVPEADFLSLVRRRRLTLLVVTAASLCLAVCMVMFLVRAYSSPLKELLGQCERIRRLDVESREPVTSSLAEVNELGASLERLRRTLDSFARYVPIDIVRELLRRGEAAKIGGRSEVLTVLFTDIRDFTTIVERRSRSPTELMAHMAEYFERLLEILVSQGATVDKFVGDSIVAFWGAPKRDPHHATRAVSAVLKCHERLKTLNQDWVDQGRDRLWTSFGLTTGSAVVGNIGAPSRLNYTALGDTVNLASRLEGLTRDYGTDMLASSETVRAATGEPFLWRHVDRVVVKGRRRPVEIYEPLGRRAEVDYKVLEFAEGYERALACYLARRFDEAIKILQGLALPRPEDRSVWRLTEICKLYRQRPPPDDWDGVARFHVT